ncbi:MAG: YraN family protein [Candidatus Gracilibacteria bacterium]|jgi:putative endonuclease
MENFGLEMEERAARYLETVRGWRLLEKNVRFREGEIDLIMEASGGLRFVEVKARRNEKFGGVVESVTTRKIQRLRKAIYRWRERSGDCRFGQIYFVGILVSPRGEFTIEEHFIE